MNLRQTTNMNSYIRNHCGLHVVTNCIWSCDRHESIIRALSYNHTDTTNGAARWEMNQGPGKHYTYTDTHTMRKCSRSLLRC